MKIAHVADLHFGVVTHGWPDPKTGVNTRILDTEAAWSAAVDVAIDAEVDLMIVAGDIFHSPNPDVESQVRFGRHLARLTGNGIAAVLIAGNHERAAHSGRSCVLDLYRGGLVDVLTEPGIAGDASGHEIRVAAVPSVSRHWMAAHLDYFTVRRNLEQAVIDGIGSVIAGLAADRFGADVLTLHWPIEGSVLGNEADISIIDEPVIPVGALTGPWAYVAAGHIHKAQPFPNHPILANGEAWGAYAGAIMPMTFADTTPTGMTIVDLDQAAKASDPVIRHAAAVFVPLPARRLVTLELSDLQGATLEGLEGAIVRIRWSGERPHDDHPQRVADRLREHEGVAKVVHDMSRVERPRPVRTATPIVESIGPIDGLDAWFDAQDIPEDDRPRLRERARVLLEGAA